MKANEQFALLKKIIRGVGRMLDEDALGATADHIYEAALVPEHWPTALDRLATIGGAQGTVLFSVTEWQTNWTASTSLLPTMQEFVEQGWAARNTRMSNGLRKGLERYPGFVTEAQYYDEMELTTDPLVQEFFRPRGLGHSAGTLAHLPHADMLCYSLERRWENGPVAEDEIQRPNLLRPHLVRAAVVAARVGYDRERTAVDAMETLGFPAVALGANGTVTLQNALAGRASGWSIGAFDRLVMASSRTRDMLATALGTISSSKGPRSIPVPDRHENVRSVLHLIPIRKSAHDVFTRAVAIAVLTSCDQQGSNPGLLQALFDLTPAEAAVADRIGAGDSVEQIAVSTARSVVTIRNQLASIYQKVGVDRQTELVRLLNRLVLPNSA